MQNSIIIRGAREHNLKNIDLSIPRDRITVITGPSGSGKSSLAIDTIYAEGQRRYVQSLSAYARQFLGEQGKPDVDYIEGLSPSIAIDQKTVTKSPRSTVGTITEIYDYMRVLYTRVGKPLCSKCGSNITTQEIESIIETVMALPSSCRIQILSPIVRDRKGEYRKELEEMRGEGFVRARIDGHMTDLMQDISLEKHKRHTIEIVIDRLIIRKPSIERQLRNSIEIALRYSDTVIVNLIEKHKDILFSRKMACPKCGVSFPEITPRLFSFNSRLGACSSCKGLGFRGIEEDAEDLSGYEPCRLCGGLRLNKEALSVRLYGKNIGEFARLSVRDAFLFVSALRLTEREQIIAERILKEVKDRLSFLERVGLGYLSMDRPSLTLSGGEAQRIRLATQIGSSLTGVLYVLDEPSIGLHPKDCRGLLKSLSSIKDRGNTVIVVEHDEETIRWADHVIDMGPGAGLRGGWVVAEGTPTEIQDMPFSVTGKFLKGTLGIPIPSKRKTSSDFIEIIGAQEFNLKNISVKIPLKVFTCVTGVSGSGKSTLIFEILYKRLAQKLYGKTEPSGRHKEIRGMEKIDKVICAPQSPLGRTPRSNPATYTGVFAFVRELFSGLTESKVRGYSASRFSFNLRGGRCEACKGEGIKKVEMHFLPAVYVSCDVCKGKRYNKETLDIKYKGMDISDVLSMTVSEAIQFFSPIPYLRQRLEVIEDVGLGYIQLGQPAPSLSGGEAQRIRLSRELAKKSTGNTLYILDEPTTGLHFVDIEKLLGVIESLINMGNTVIVIEHNPDVVKSADWVIDLGPGGGGDGGWVVAEGTPEEVSMSMHSYTGMVLKEKLK
ncbi:MAG: excinuclease ABC subunit UvrA [Nitrospirae bacterium]|nr:excinuclease ABC subunit UvrA [Nitrospirota bacterium]